MSEFRRIGAGCCGSIWASSSESSIAYKREDGARFRSVVNDYNMHQLLQNVLNTQAQLQLRFRIPTCHRLIASSDSWWNENSSRFPRGCRPGFVIQAQRIPPVVQQARELLIDTYCPIPLREEIKKSEPNKDCLIRPYLGSRRILDSEGRPRPKTFFSLRNHALHLDQIEELGVHLSDMKAYAQAMAEALAVMHWDAGIDANDVEFVLAPSPASQDCQTTEQKSIETTNVLGTNALWLLDFDLCNTMPMDEGGIQQAVTAFFRNDPYYPRPQSSPLLWEVFREQYLLSSKVVGATERDQRVLLSGMFIKAIEGRDGVCEFR